MQWFNPQSEPFKIYGFPFYEKEMTYRRLPLGLDEFLPEASYRLADETSGGQIRFRAKFKALTLQVSVNAKPGMYAHVSAPHTTGTTKQSFDLYVSKDGKDYIFCDVSKNMSKNPRFYERKLLDFEEAQEFDVLLNFPTYGGVDKVLIGLDDEAQVMPPLHKFKDDRKIAFYGGSIQQGSNAGRAGTTMANIIGRWLNREVYNFGFNSSAKAEPEIADVIADAKNVAALVISTEGNCPDSEWLDTKLREFIKIYRAKNPTCEIVIMPFLVSGRDTVIPNVYERRLRDREIQKKIVSDFKNSGDEHIHLFIQDDFLPKDAWHEVTIDGLHLNELGFYYASKGLYEFLTQLGL